MSTKLFVGGIPTGTTSDELTVLFAPFGGLIKADVVKDYAFVHYVTADSAYRAMSTLNDTMYEGSRLRVDISTSKVKDPHPNTCYYCGQHGHFSKDCPTGGTSPVPFSSGPPLSIYPRTAGSRTTGLPPVRPHPPIPPAPHAYRPQLPPPPHVYDPYYGPDPYGVPPPLPRVRAPLPPPPPSAYDPYAYDPLGPPVDHRRRDPYVDPYGADERLVDAAFLPPPRRRERSPIGHHSVVTSREHSPPPRTQGPLDDPYYRPPPEYYQRRVERPHHEEYSLH